MSSKQQLSLEVRLKALDEATRPMQMVGRAGQQMAKQLSIAQNQAKSLSRALADGSGTEQFKRNLEQVAARIDRIRKANDSYQRSIALRDNLANAGVKMGVAGAAMGAAAMVPVKAFAEAEDAGTQLAVSMMKSGGQVSANFEKANELAMRLGNRLPGTTADFQNMMTVLNRQGISEQAILGGLGEAAALLGVQLKMPFDQAAEFAAKLQDATRTTESDMLGLMDVIQRSFYMGVDSNNMLAGFAKMSPALATIRKQGLEAARVLAPLLVMADQSGMDGSAAGNAIRKVVQKALLRDSRGDKPGEFGLDFTDGKGEFGGFEKLFDQLSKLKRLSSEERGGIIKTIFGDDAEVTQVVSLLIDKGQAGYDEVLRKMQAQANLQDRVNKQLGTLKNLWDAATGTFTNALAAFGETISPELKAVTEWIGRIAEATQKWAKENPALSGGLMKIVAGGALLFTALGGIALAASALIGPFAMAKLAIGVMGGAGLKMIALSVPLLAAIGGIAWAAYEIYQNWDGIAAWFRQQWETVTSFMSGLAARFEQIGLDVMLGLSRGIRNAAGAVKDAVFSTADNVTNWFKSKLGINSPSRVFMELGGYTMAGLVQGVGKGEPGALKAIGEFSRRFATTAALGMAGAGIATAAPMPTTADRPLMTSSPRALPAAAPAFSYVINIDARGGADETNIRRVVKSELEEGTGATSRPAAEAYSATSTEEQPMDETPTTRPMSADRRRRFEPLLDWMADRILEELLAEAAAENPPIDRPPVEPAPAVTGDAHQVQPETGLSRLQAEKARKQRQADELAKELGEAWALNQATYDELELAAGLHPSRLGRTPTAADLEALGKRLVESPAPLSVLPSSSPAAVVSFIEGLHDVFLKI